MAHRIAYGLLVQASLALWLMAAPPGEGAPTEVRWDAPSACPNEVTVRTAVEELLGVPLTEPRPRRLTVIAAVQAGEPGWSLRIFTITAEGTRERALRYDRDCAVLARAAAVLIAIAIDPEVLGRLDPQTLALVDPPAEISAPAEISTPAPVAACSPGNPSCRTTADPAVPASLVSREAPPVVHPPPAGILPSVEAPTTRSRRPRPRAGLRIAGGLGWGDLPSVGGGLSLAAAMVLPRVRVEALGAVWPARRVRLGTTGAGGNFLSWTLGARVCPVVRLHRVLELPICAGFEAGRVLVESVQLVDANEARSPWFSFIVAPALVYTPRPWLALWLAPELVIPTIRTAFQVSDVGVIHRAQPANVRALLGVEFRFPRSIVMDRPGSRN